MCQASQWGLTHTFTLTHTYIYSHTHTHKLNTHTHLHSHTHTDLSAAFDTIDHNILLNRLEISVGISRKCISRVQIILIWPPSIHSREWRGTISITSAVWSTSRLSTRTVTFHALHVTLGRYHECVFVCVCVYVCAVWSTSRLSTRAVTFHALHITLGKYHQETWG